MYTTNSLLQEIYDETGLDSSNKNMILNRVNDYQRQICALEDWNWLDDSFSITTVADRQVYTLPIDLLRITTIYATVSGSKYDPLQEIVSPTEFDRLSSYGDTSSSDYPQVFQVREGDLYIWPKTSTAGNTFTVWYKKRPLPIKTEDYSTGTIAVTTGDETVTGTGTLWSTYLKAGNKIQINDKWYTIASIASNTALELTKKYQGVTETGIDDYLASDTPIIPEDYQSILWKKFCEEYYTKVKDNDKRAMYQQMRLETMKDLKKFSSSESTTNVWANSNGTRLINPNRHSTITVTY